MKIDLSQSGDLDPPKMKISEVAVKGITIFRALQGIGQKDIRQAVVVDVTDRDGVTNRHQPLRKMPYSRVSLVHYATHLGIDSRN